MAERRESIHGHWSGNWAFFLAATGSAVGLGNIWKFPYITGMNGGGAFVLVYLVCIAVVGIPIMMAEILLGREGRRSPINTMHHLAEEAGKPTRWRLVAWLGVVAGFIILSYYSVIAGWAMAYFFRTAGATFAGADAETVKATFGALVSDPERLLAWHTIFLVLTIVVVSRGVRGGLEKAVRYMMPALFAILLLLVGYALNTGYFSDGLAFLFTPDFSKLSANGVLIAMGHAFFTLSLGMGAIMVYGSYLPERVSIVRISLYIAAADTGVALLAGMAIFPIVFANGLSPDKGAGLVFQVLPIAFGHMPGGTFFGALFFLLLFFAAWSSAISLVEPLVAWLVENRGLTRLKAAIWTGIGTWLLGIGTVFSFNIWSGEEYQLFGKTLFDLLDFLTANVMLPLGGLFIALFTGWVLKRETVREALGAGEGWAFRLWYLLIRYITPVAVGVVFLNVVGILDLS